MRIVFLSTNFPPDPGGISEFSHQVCSALAVRGHEVIVLTHRAAGEPAEAHAAGYRLRRVFAPCPSSTLRTPLGFARMQVWKYSARSAIVRAVREATPHLVIAGNYHSTLTPAVLNRLGVSYYLCLHGGDVSMGLATRLPFRRKALMRTISESRGVFCNSSYTANLTKQICPESMGRLTEVGCGYPVGRIVASPDRASARRRLGFGRERILLTVARLVPNKGVDNVLRALPLVVRDHPDCRYVVIGDGRQRLELEALAARVGVRDRVSFMGHVSEEIKDLAYQAADLYVMTSESGHGHEIEGFGISFLEANANGLAVIGTRVGGVPEAVRDGWNGILVEPRNPPELARAVAILLDDPQRCLDMARAGAENIRSRYNWSSITALMEAKLLE